MPKKNSYTKKEMYLEFVYQKEANLDDENNFTIVFLKRTASKKKNLSVVKNIFCLASTLGSKAKILQSCQTMTR